MELLTDTARNKNDFLTFKIITMEAHEAIKTALHLLKNCQPRGHKPNETEKVVIEILERANEKKTPFSRRTNADIYREYLNNWLTLDAMAENYGRTLTEMNQIIQAGKEEHEQMLKQLK